MTKYNPQVTDEMVEAAMKATQRHAPFHISTMGMRAALEAALAVRGRTTDAEEDAEELVKRLRLWATHRNNVPLGWIEEAADMIERQAEEIAALSHTVKEAGLTNIRLTAERTELIEALRPFIETCKGLTFQNDEMPLEFGPNKYDLRGFIKLGHLRRARALLERLGEKM